MSQANLRVVWDGEETARPWVPSPASQQPQANPEAGRDERLRLTLREAYQEHVLPALRIGKRPATIREYGTVLNLWDQFLQADAEDQNTRTYSPSVQGESPSVPLAYLHKIDSAAIIRFQGWRRAHCGSAATAAKTCRQLKALLGRLRKAKLIDLVPDFETIPGAAGSKDEEPARVLTEHELNCAYRACSVAKWPELLGQNMPCDLWWRAAIVTYYFCGLRTQDLISYESVKLGLVRSNLHFTEQSPSRRCKASHPHGWLSFTPQKTRETGGKRIVIPLHECCRLHLNELLYHGEDRLFPCTKNSRYFRLTWDAIQTEAWRISGGQYERFTIQDLRETCNNAWDTASGLAQTLPMGRWILGHSKLDVNDTFYKNPQQDLARAIAHFFVPSQFTDGADKLRPEQKQLF